MAAPSTTDKFDRCPKCYAVIRYKVGDSHVVCPNCSAKIKLPGTGK